MPVPAITASARRTAMPAARFVRVRRRRVTATLFAAGLLLVSQSAMAVSPDRAGATTHPPYGHGMPRPVPAKPPAANVPGPLPMKAGSIRVDAAPLAAATPATAKFALRALVIATDATDWGRDTWKATLDRVGAGYDILYARDTALTRNTLVRADGTGKYGAILLTNSELAVQDAGGTVSSALTGDEWNLLWGYERDFGVRQATLYTSYGTFPEDYCRRGGGGPAVGAPPLTPPPPPAGTAVFSYLNPAARIPITQSYVYRDTLAAGCGAQPVLTAGSNVL